MTLLPVAGDGCPVRPSVCRPVEDPVLVERSVERAQLADVVGSLAGGTSRVALVEGPAGIGRSALLVLVERQARAAGCRVLRARGVRTERGLDLALARSLVGGETAARPCGAVPGDRHAELNGLLGCVARLANREPVLLVVDDVQWADAASVRFLGYLARRIEDLPVGIVMAVRGRPSADVRLPLAELCVDGDPVRVRPRPLSPAAVAAMVRHHVGPGAGPAVVAACAEATAGRPFLVAELCRELATTARIDVPAVQAALPARVALQVELDLAAHPATVGAPGPADIPGAARAGRPVAGAAAEALVAAGVAERRGTAVHVPPLVARVLQTLSPNEGSRRPPRPQRRVQVLRGSARDAAASQPARLDRLTGGERRVVECAARGGTNVEIAGALSVSVKTVEMHLSSVYRKLGVVRSQLGGLVAAGP